MLPFQKTPDNKLRDKVFHRNNILYQIPIGRSVRIGKIITQRCEQFNRFCSIITELNFGAWNSQHHKENAHQIQYAVVPDGHGQVVLDFAKFMRRAWA